MKKYTVQFNNVRDGLSDDKYIAPISTLYDASNVDIRTNPVGVQLSPALINESWTFDSPIVGMIDMTAYGHTGILTYHENGKVMLDGVLKFTFSGTSDDDKKIYNVAIRTDANLDTRIYYIGNKYIHISDLDLTASSTDFFTIGTNFDSISRPVLVNGDQLLIGVGQGLYEFKGLIGLELTGVLSAKYAYDTGLKIMSITYSGSLWNIYVTQGNGTSGSSFIFKTDLKQKQPLYIVPMENNPIKNVISSGSIEYVITGSNYNYSELYKTSGFDRILVKKGLETTGGSGKYKFYQGIHQACNRRDKLYIAGKQSGNIGIFSYGGYFPTISPNAMTFDNVVIPNGTSGDITCIMPATNFIYVGYTINSVHKVGKIAIQYPASKYCETGEYITNSFTAGAFFPEKTIESMAIMFDLSSSTGHSGSIDLYQSVNEGSWVLVGSYTTRDDRFVEILPNMIPKRDFYEVKFKYVLHSGNNGSDTPVCMGLYMKYYPIKI